MSSSIESFDIFRVHRNSGAGILHHLIPFAEGIVTGSSVGVVDGVWFADNGLAVEIDRLVVIFGAICFVARCF